MNLQELISVTKESCLIQGLCGCAKGWFFQKWQEIYKRPVIVITKGSKEAEDWLDDIRTFGCRDSAVFPEWEDFGTLGSLELQGERWSILEKPPVFLIVPLLAFKHKVVPPSKISEIRFKVERGMNFEMNNLLKWLVDEGFDRVDVVDIKGEFSHRGGIIDVFPTNSQAPIRIEFLGNTIESLRNYDPQTQCSQGEIDTPVYLYPADEYSIYKKFQNELVSIEEYFSKETIVVLDEPGDVTDIEFKSKEKIELSQLVLLKDKIFVDMLSLDYLSIPKRTPDLLSMAKERIFEEMSLWVKDKYKIQIWCNNDGERKRLSEWLTEKGLSSYTTGNNPQILIGIGRISSGFVFADEKLVVISDEEIFNRYKIRLPRRRFKGYGVPIREFSELQEGDYVVHVDHGIGKYLGVQKEGKKEMLVIQYAEKAKLYVPMRNVYLVERYMAIGGRTPKLNQLGGKKWLKTKIKVERSLLDMAGELLEMQAKRQELKGYVFSADTTWQKEMEDSFIYEETIDQQNAINEVKHDMESAYPMDRLICGDVGYGKTEVAVRAAFKAVMDGKQVAIIVPTTILAQQHYRTFSERFADYPVRVEMLSRFRSDKEQKNITKALADSKIDIIVGTHRLIQSDVKFKNLGLVIIDEEQRFGVRHKEHLKKMRELVDVITMTATPIPRTLYMALMGIRDMSTISTPPQQRLSVETILLEYDERVIKQAIIRELSREGQVFFLHNRVETIDRVAEKLEKLVPEARFLVGHGQMDEETLSYVMDEFVQGRADVLVCTTIIQSGLDIPNANTIIIDRADTFGLADLYQLRGRVGRYKSQAYAYLLLPKGNILTGIAKKRLKAIKDFSHLGAGFKIAMQDLEIRGAGNILGVQQHGQIQAVGFDMYCKLLHRNILKLRGKEAETPYEVKLDVDISGNIPSEYIASDRIRIEFYKRISEAVEKTEIDDLEKELKDRFGPMPEEASCLLDVSRIKICAIKQKIKEIKIQGDMVYFTWFDGRRYSEKPAKDKLNWIKKKVCGTMLKS
jgi:transcription-repair coupling factor (superfamily II helicase)